MRREIHIVYILLLMTLSFAIYGQSNDDCFHIHSSDKYDDEYCETVCGEEGIGGDMVQMKQMMSSPLPTFMNTECVSCSECEGMDLSNIADFLNGADTLTGGHTFLNGGIILDDLYNSIGDVNDSLGVGFSPELITGLLNAFDTQIDLNNLFACVNFDCMEATGIFSDFFDLVDYEALYLEGIDTAELRRQYDSVLLYLDTISIDQLIRDSLGITSAKIDCPYLQPEKSSGNSARAAETDIFSGDILGLGAVGTDPSSSFFDVSAVTVGVDKYNGLAQASIAIYNYVNKDINIPIAFNYSGSGIHLDNVGGELGQNWEMSIGSSIVRKTNGLPDEYNGGQTGYGMGPVNNSLGGCFNLAGIGLYIGKKAKLFDYDFNRPEEVRFTISILLPIPFVTVYLTVSFNIKVQVLTTIGRIEYRQRGMGYLHLYDEAVLDDYGVEDSVKLSEFGTDHKADFKFLDDADREKGLNDQAFLEPSIRRFVEFFKAVASPFLGREIINTRKIDTEPDEFYINIPGYSGKFMFTQDGEIVTFPHSDFIIEKTIDANRITKFVVHSTDGKSYFFGDQAIDESRTASYTLANIFSYHPRETFHPINRYYNRVDLDEGDHGFMASVLCLPRYGKAKKSYENHHTVMPGIPYISKWHLYKVESRVTNQEVELEYESSGELTYYNSQNITVQFPNFPVTNSGDYIFEARQRSYLKNLGNTNHTTYLDGTNTLNYVVSQTYLTKSRLTGISGTGIRDNLMFEYGQSNPEVYGDKLLTTVTLKKDSTVFRSWDLDYMANPACPLDSNFVISCEDTITGYVPRLGITVPGEWTYRLYDEKTKQLFRTFLEHVTITLSIPKLKTVLPISFGLPFLSAYGNNGHIKEFNERASVLKVKAFTEGVNTALETEIWRGEFSRIFLTSVSERGHDNLSETKAVVEYEGDICELPKKMSFNRDKWGYYNGTENNSPIPPLVYVDFKGDTVSQHVNSRVGFHIGIVNSDGSDLAIQNDGANLTKCVIGALKSIEYKTGLKYSYEYELHDLAGGGSGAGLRVRSLEKNPGIGAIQRISYEYANPTQISNPVFVSQNNVNTTIFGRENYVVASSSPLNAIQQNKSHLVGYGEVTEYFEDNGKIVTEYTSPLDYGPIQFETKVLETSIRRFNWFLTQNPDYYNAPRQDSDPFAPKYAKTWRYGLEKRVEVFDESAVLKTRSDYSYVSYPAVYCFRGIGSLEEGTEGGDSDLASVSGINPETLPSGCDTLVVLSLHTTNFQINRPAIQGLVHSFEIFQKIRQVLQFKEFEDNYVVQQILEILNSIITYGQIILDSANEIVKIKLYTKVEYESEQFELAGIQTSEYFEDSDSLSSVTVNEYVPMETMFFAGSLNLPYGGRQIPLYNRLKTQTSESGGFTTQTKHYYPFEETSVYHTFKLSTVPHNVLAIIRNNAYNPLLRTEEYYEGVLVGGHINSLHYIYDPAKPNFVTKAKYKVESEDFVPSVFYDEWDDRGNPGYVQIAPVGATVYAPSETKGTIRLSWGEDDVLTSKTYLGSMSMVDSFEYNDFSQVVKRIDTEGLETRYEYDGLSRVKEITGRSGLYKQYITYGFNPTVKRDSTVFMAAGDGAPPQTLTTSYNGLGQLLSVQRTDGAMLQEMTYDNMFRVLTSSELGSGSVENTYEYSPQERLKLTVDAAGNQTEYAYLGGRTYTSFSNPAMAVEIKDPNGHVSIELKDGLSRTVGRISGEGGATKYYYDYKGRLDSISNPIGQSYTYQYNKMEKLSSKKVPNSAKEVYYYNAYRQPVVTIDGNLNTFSTEYDEYLRPWKGYFADSHITVTTDGNDMVTNAGAVYSVSELGSLTVFEGGTNRVESVQERIIDPVSGVSYVNTSYDYDSYGRLYEENISYYSGQVVANNRYTYTGGEMVKEATKVINGNTILFKNTYDEVLRLQYQDVKIRNNAQRRLFSLDYDAEDRVVKKELFSPDEDILQQIDYTYDGIGRITAINSPFTTDCYYPKECEWHLNYRIHHHIAALNRSDGDKIELLSGSCYVISHIVVNGVRYPVTYTLDLLTMSTEQIAEILQMIFGDLRLDIEVRIDSTVVYNPPSEYYTDYNIYISGVGLTEIILESEVGLPYCVYGFNPTASCCEDEEEEDPDENKDLFFEVLTYDGLDISQIEMGNGCSLGIVQSHYTYDADHRLRAVKTYQIFEAEIEEDNYNSTYTYDAAGNLMTLLRNGWIETDTLTGKKVYDEIDNLQYRYNSQGELIQVRELGVYDNGVKTGQHGISPDSKGNITSLPGGVTLDYNVVSMPKVITSDSMVQKIWYTATGRKLRVLEEPATGTPVTRYYIDQFEVLQTGFTSPKVSSINFGDGKIYIDAQDRTEYYLKDHLGNVMVVFEDVDRDGKVAIESDSLPGEILERYMYYAFGMQWEGAWDYVSPSGDSTNRMRYNGKEFLSGSQLYDYGARYYAPQIGRWNAVDPLAEAMPSWSPYNYGFNAPIRFIDPTGMAPEDTYGVDNKGNITKIDDKKYYDKDGNEVDMLVQGTKVRYDKNGDVKNNHTYVKSGVLKQGLTKRSFESGGKTYDYTHMSTGSDESAGLNLFEFLGNNTNVEWSIMQTAPFEGVTSHSIFSSHIYDKEFAGSSLLFDNRNPGLIETLNYHYHSHPPTYKMGDTSRLSPSDADRDFAKRVRTAGSSATLKVFFNGQYSSGY